MKDSLRGAYDPEEFRRRGHAVIDRLADHLTRASSRDAMPVLPWMAPLDALAAWPADFDAPHEAEFDALVARVIEGSNHLHSPRFVGHQVSAPLPIAALCDLIGALLNNSMAVYEMGPVSTAMERSLARWMTAKLGFSSEGDAVFTSGGSAGNLTALLAARQKMAGFDAWTLGNAGGPPLCVLASEQSHYSILRACQIMGWGKGGVQPVPVDARFRMRADALADAHAAATRDGRKVIAVVASAASTSTGAFDDLRAVADFAQKQGLWFHVDGAHGASCAISERHRGLVDGIDRADSVVWDAHKMMMMPSLVTAVLFRNGADSYEAFAQHASYLFEAEREADAEFHGALRTLECTKRMMSTKLYLALRVHGAKVFAAFVDDTIDLAQRFAALLRSQPDFDVAVEPQCNIVCFRYTPVGVAPHDLDALQARIVLRTNQSGAFYIVKTTLPTGVHLRTTLINPRTTDADLALLLETIRGVTPTST